MNLGTAEDKTLEGRASCDLLERDVHVARGTSEVEEYPPVYRRVSLGLPLGVLTNKGHIE